MSFMEWEERFSVGHPDLDADHRKLIGMINEVAEVDASPEKMRNVLLSLIDYTHTHFRREEEVLAAAGFPDLENHKREHMIFESWLGSIRSSHTSPDGDEEIVEKVSKYLKFWLSHHILEEDMRYKPYLP